MSEVGHGEEGLTSEGHNFCSEENVLYFDCSGGYLTVDIANMYEI